jgi:proteasome accessory factor A
MPDAKIVMGQETEYGFPLGSDDYGGFGSSSMEWLGVPYSVDDDQGMLANGARFYIDCDHPEYATPECASPWDLVRCARAGDMLVAKWAKRYRKENETARGHGYPVLSNVSYVLDDFEEYEYRHDELGSGDAHGDVWGSHESYSMRNQDVISKISTHIATRPILSGAGGIYKGSFVLSPRILAMLGTNHSLAEYGIEQKGLGRLHVKLGDTLCSDKSLFLKFASTSLLVLIADNEPGWRVVLRNPVESMRTVLLDPSMSKRLAMMDGSEATAVQLQSQLASFCGKFIRKKYMPGWAQRALAIWRDHVRLLSSGPAAVSRSLDWGIKYALYAGMKGRPLSKALMVDSKFGILGPGGVFSSLKNAGALDCRLPGGLDVASVLMAPPKWTRAEARGRAIRECYQAGGAYNVTADWEHVEMNDQYVFKNGDPRVVGGYSRYDASKD